MVSRAAFKNLKHRTKKGVMLRIGKTESQPEEPSFKCILTTLREAKVELKNIYNTSRSVADSGKKYSVSLEKSCGFALRSEDVFHKEAEFLNTLDAVCKSLGTIMNKDFNALEEFVVQYKTAKLKFDATYFKTVKKMKKQELPVTGKNVMQSNPNLKSLHEAYETSKKTVNRQCAIILSHLKNRLGGGLAELAEVSEAQHHKLYCQYFQERLDKMTEICSDDETNSEASSLLSTTLTTLIGSSRKNSNAIGNGTSKFPAGNDTRVEDRKDAKHESAENLSVAPKALGQDVDGKAAAPVAENLHKTPEANGSSLPH